MTSKQRVVIITGASRGIGAALVKRFRGLGYGVVATSREELAIEAKVYASETAVRVLTNLMRTVGVDSYDHALPLGRLLQDALALPLFGGGNDGVRRRRLHAILQRPEYDPFEACGQVEV